MEPDFCFEIFKARQNIISCIEYFDWHFWSILKKKKKQFNCCFKVEVKNQIQYFLLDSKTLTNQIIFKEY